MEGDENNLTGSVKRVVLNNLLDNPPKAKKSRPYFSDHYTTPYLFDSASNDMHFVQLGHRHSIISDSQLEKNREKHAEILEEEKRKREKAKILDKELGLDKKHDTKDLARIDKKFN